MSLRERSEESRCHKVGVTEILPPYGRLNDNFVLTGILFPKVITVSKVTEKLPENAEKLPEKSSILPEKLPEKNEKLIEKVDRKLLG